MSQSSPSQSKRGERTTRRAERRLAAERAAKKRRYAFLGGAIALAIILTAVLVFANLGGGNSSLPAIAAAPALDPAIPVDGRTMGDPNAPVTFIEWADYQCPYCQQFSTTVAPLIIQNYVLTGKIKWTYRDFPIIGPESEAAAVAASCADDQGKFWQYHDTLFANHGAENSGAFSKSRLEKMAEVVGLDMDEFRSCVSKNPHKDEIADGKAGAIKDGINSTPSFQVNGKLISNGNYQHFQEAIDAALAGN